MYHDVYRWLPVHLEGIYFPFLSTPLFLVSPQLPRRRSWDLELDPSSNIPTIHQSRMGCQETRYYTPSRPFSRAFIHLFIEVVITFIRLYTPSQVCGSQRTSLRRCFSSSTTWVLGIKLGSSGLVASASTHWAIPVNPVWMYIHMHVHMRENAFLLC